MRGASHRRPTNSFNPQPTPDHHRHQYANNSSRDSDASFASSRPSSIGVGRTADPYTEKAHQASAIRAINAYLSSHSAKLLPPNSTPSGKDITETLKYLLHQLDYESTKLEDDLASILKSLNCPFKFNKSTLRAPNTPHNWPSYVAIIHWLVQLAMYREDLVAKTGSLVENNSMFMYALDSYLNYIRGNDDSVLELDNEFMGKLVKGWESVLGNVRVLEASLKETEANAEALRAGPTERERLEKERSVLEEDVKKFHAMIGEFNQGIEVLEKGLEEKRKEMETKVEEKKKLDEENDELKKRVEEQSFNPRDAERMKRELQVVDRDIVEAEASRNAWEEKMWDLDATIAHKFKEIEALAMECNQATRRLKLGNGYQYVPNANGSTAAEIMGLDYKSTIKPGLESFAAAIKGSSMAKLEELILLQQQSSELAAKIEGKRNRTSTLQSHIDEVEAQLNLLRKETEDSTSRCAAEAKKLVEDVQIEAHNLDVLEREAAEIVKAAEQKLQEAIKTSEEEIQMQAVELLALVDSVSKCKEQIESKISESKIKLSETVVAVSNAYKGSLSAQFGINLDINH
ncbi:PREDICTED: probable kinetochore protein ndc80 [Populus euphratica]|uniref:Kinetochore protein NDC80 n=1 Tax=Populus euphratica TaxID=75702 RepID=A0AAJ6Y8A8_POPEU|nr:PREDICTED: probable kinetochore protein ndc80 [Populus euphratica]